LEVNLKARSRKPPPWLSREFLGGVTLYDFFVFFFSFKLRTWASSSASVAQPAKYRHNISKVRLVGLWPVHSAISKLAISAR
jgi:hypothetical protein